MAAHPHADRAVVASVNPAIAAQVVWLVVGVLTCVFAVIDLYRVRSVLAILALIAGVLLVLGAVGVWP
jgi:cell division protein FtsW (lipid II flippase)